MSNTVMKTVTASHSSMIDGDGCGLQHCRTCFKENLYHCIFWAKNLL